MLILLILFLMVVSFLTDPPPSWPVLITFLLMIPVMDGS